MTEPSFPEHFDIAMHELYGRIVRECGERYHPTRFHGMLETYGGLETARRLLRDPNFFSYGFERLCELGRADLTMEAMILSLGYRSELFTPEELATATERLAIGKELSARRSAAAKSHRRSPPEPSSKPFRKKRPAS